MVFQEGLLANKSVIVTGGGSGLGLSMAKRFLGLGASVTICGRNEEKLRRAAEGLDSSGKRVFAHQADVRDFDQVEALVRATVDRFGSIDVLVNNAAGNFLAATEDITPKGFNAVVQTVLYGAFHATLAVGRHMIQGGRRGNILNILTTYVWTGSAFVVPSAAAKAGVLALTRSLAVEWASYGIRLNAIAPGPFPTEGAWQRLVPTPEAEARALARVPMGRFGRHEELANLAAFLISDGAAFINGECVTIDGGEWLASGGEFNELARGRRSEVKEMMRRLREATRGP